MPDIFGRHGLELKGASSLAALMPEEELKLDFFRLKKHDHY